MMAIVFFLNYILLSKNQQSCVSTLTKRKDFNSSAQICCEQYQADAALSVYH